MFEDFQVFKVFEVFEVSRWLENLFFEEKIAFNKRHFREPNGAIPQVSEYA